MLSLHDREWKEFDLREVFPYIQRGKRLKSADHIDGNTPYVSSSAMNNGVDDFVSNESGVRKFADCLTLANSGSVGKTFYHSYEFVASDHVTALQSPHLNKYSYIFVATLVERLQEKYSFNREINDLRINREKVLLPVDDFGNPDYAFMEEYIRERERQIVQNYISHIGKNIQIGGGTTPLNKKSWAEFELTEIFDISPGKRLTKSDMRPGNKPFIGATDSNNGVTAFTSSTNASEDCNVLGVNYNGSVVENFFHPYTCLFSDDVKRFRTKQVAGNKYTYLFLKTVILQQKAKYTYGYKFNEQRMRKQILLLPVNEAGEPDWVYMEEYGKYLFAKLKLQYLQEKQLIPA